MERNVRGEENMALLVKTMPRESFNLKTASSGPQINVKNRVGTENTPSSDVDVFVVPTVSWSNFRGPREKGRGKIRRGGGR